MRHQLTQLAHPSNWWVHHLTSFCSSKFSVRLNDFRSNRCTNFLDRHFLAFHLKPWAQLAQSVARRSSKEQWRPALSGSLLHRPPFVLFCFGPVRHYPTLSHHFLTAQWAGRFFKTFESTAWLPSTGSSSAMTTKIFIWRMLPPKMKKHRSTTCIRQNKWPTQEKRLTTPVTWADFPTALPYASLTLVIKHLHLINQKVPAKLGHRKLMRSVTGSSWSNLTLKRQIKSPVHLAHLTKTHWMKICTKSRMHLQKHPQPHIVHPLNLLEKSPASSSEMNVDIDFCKDLLNKLNSLIRWQLKDY